IPRNQVKGNTPENMLAAEKEIARCVEMQVLVNQVLKMEEIVKDDNVLFAATGITTGDLLKGVHRKGSMLFTETLLIRGRSHTVRRVESLHDVSRMDD
ncbi:MAG: fructose-bisphosphatase class II, partial [Haemophilus parahaemolyticus]|nr:fructose-bisphosphatase class II [Haemophilus parahaemolyticus]